MSLVHRVVVALLLLLTLLSVVSVRGATKKSLLLRRSRRSLNVEYVAPQRIFYDYNFGDGRTPWGRSSKRKTNAELLKDRQLLSDNDDRKMSYKERDEVAAVSFVTCED